MKSITTKTTLLMALLCCAWSMVLSQNDGQSIITEFTLVNANTNSDITTLSNGDMIVLSDLASDDLNIRADVSGSVGSIKFQMTSSDGTNNRNENVAPYALFGDSKGNYAAWTPKLITYELTATAYSSKGSKGSILGTKTATFSFTGQTTASPPSAATNLTGSASAVNQINLAWSDNSNNEDGFIIQYQNTAGTFVELASVSANTSTYTDNDTNIGASRTYRVISFNSEGNAAASNQVTVTNVVTNVPDQITGFIATEVSPDNYVLSWDAPDFGVRYRLMSSPTGTGNWSLVEVFINEAGDYTYDYGSVGSTTLFFRLRIFSLDNSERSIWSESLRVDGNTTVTPPAAASNLSGNASNHDQITLSWSDNANNEDESIIQFLNGAGNFVDLTSVSANITSYTDTQLSIGESRTYRVLSSNTAGAAAPSNQISVTNVPDQITGFSATEISNNNYELSWNTPDFGLEYQLQSSPSGTGNWSLVEAFTDPTGDNTYDLGNIGSTTTFYRIRIASADGTKQSSWSQVIEINRDPVTPGGAVTGELRTWHKVTVTFDGPNLTELSGDNPFMNYRLNVTFTSPVGETFVVPGYFAADGDAANSLATGGNKWVAHISPNTTGNWSYNASFVSGNNVAVNLNANAGTPTSFNGTSGTFTISATNKGGRDFRGKGRLSYDNKNYLRFEGSNEFFIKAGADAPENTLAYDDFDGTTNISNNRKSWAPHQRDYDANDAGAYTWGNNKGTELLGAIKYLSDQGMNAFSFLTFNVEGDGKNVFPHIKSGNGGSWNNDFHKLRMDVSKLAQWEKVFEYADKKGMFLHIKTVEKENDFFMDGGFIGPERQLYFRELIARFGHHLALNWNLGEESDMYSNVRGEGIGDTELVSVKSWAKYIEDLDPYDHLIVIHTAKSQKDAVYPKLLGNQSVLTGASLQTFFQKSNSNAHDDVIEWVSRSNATSTPWVVTNDEQGEDGDGGKGVTVDRDYPINQLPQNTDRSENRDEVRHRALWGTLLAGGAGVEYYYGSSTGCGDTKCQDHRTRESKYKDAKIALDFFEEHLKSNLLDLTSADNVTSANNDYVFAEENQMYVIYLPNGGSTSIDLGNNGNTYDVRWYDPRNGGSLQTTNVASITASPNRNIGTPPNNQTEDWIVLITRNTATANSRSIATDIDMDFVIHPNPAVDYVTVNTGNATKGGGYELQILSVTGQVLSVQEVQSGETQINVSGLAPGMYNIMLSDAVSNAVKKLLIVR